MTIGILGAGYVGLATAAGFAARGSTVVCADPNEEKIRILQAGELPFFECGMLDVFREAAVPVIFTTDLDAACRCDVVFCCVGTPSAADGSADLSYVRSAAETCARVAPHAVFILKSTVPPGTSRAITAHIGGQLRVAANPEFLREGNAVEDALHPSRIVLGADDSLMHSVLASVYQGVDAPIVATDTVTAELIKYASNSFLATKISFINDIATLCDAIGADVKTVAHGMGLDDRIGPKFLQPGPGFGGSCFPKDVRALQHLGATVHVPLQILDAAMRVNADRQRLSVDRVRTALGTLSGKRIAIWGLAFKPGTDDVRDAPSLSVIDACLAEGAEIFAYDPLVRSLPGRYARVSFAPSAIEALHGADALIVMTDWPEFFTITRETIQKYIQWPSVIDLRGVIQ